ncbi:MAG: hypothetical protein NZ700_17245 [Gemmataceae bacterium]|nr:hypothetical protein [Gemmataceae bacterium]MDW8264846.1 hypothetical protein [Gemmataceae bacterium]
MRPGIVCGIGALALASSAALTVGQAPRGSAAARDLSKFPPLQRQMFLSAQRGAEWLFRANRPDGKFVDGFVPALHTKLDGDHYLGQVSAAAALAAAARYFGDDRYAVRARQALLTLLLDTTTATHPTSGETIRHTSLPSVVVNRLGAAGLLTLAIHELPQPGGDLLKQADELCRFIRLQQRDDGSFRCTDQAEHADDVDSIGQYPGLAVHALAVSQRHQPAPWKAAVLRKAFPFYRAWWSKNRGLSFVSAQSPAAAEWFGLTKEQPAADFVFEMNEWLCGLQYVQLDPRHPLWSGGFMAWSGGRAVASAPDANSALGANSLVEACRVARQLGDVPRFTRYRDALERCLQFLATLQYTEANTQHFADWYRPLLVGAFHVSHEDGNLRVDHTGQAVWALVRYLDQVADVR